MKTSKRLAEELVVHSQTVREMLDRVDRHNAAVTKAISVQEARLLMSLGTRGALTISETARTLHLTLSSATSIVDKLEQKQLIKRSRSAADRRLVQVALTAPGRKVFGAMAAVHLALAEKMLGLLGPAEQEIFVGMFRRIARMTDPVVCK